MTSTIPSGTSAFCTKEPEILIEASTLLSPCQFFSSEPLGSSNHEAVDRLMKSSMPDFPVSPSPVSIVSQVTEPKEISLPVSEIPSHPEDQQRLLLDRINEFLPLPVRFRAASFNSKVDDRNFGFIVHVRLRTLKSGSQSLEAIVCDSNFSILTANRAAHSCLVNLYESSNFNAQRVSVNAFNAFYVFLGGESNKKSEISDGGGYWAPLNKMMPPGLRQLNMEAIREWLTAPPFDIMETSKQASIHRRKFPDWKMVTLSAENYRMKRKRRRRMDVPSTTDDDGFGNDLDEPMDPMLFDSEERGDDVSLIRQRNIRHTKKIRSLSEQDLSLISPPSTPKNNPLFESPPLVQRRRRFSDLSPLKARRSSGFCFSSSESQKYLDDFCSSLRNFMRLPIVDSFSKQTLLRCFSIHLKSSMDSAKKH